MSVLARAVATGAGLLIIDIGSDHFPLLVDVLLQREGSYP